MEYSLSLGQPALRRVVLAAYRLADQFEGFVLAFVTRVKLYGYTCLSFWCLPKAILMEVWLLAPKLYGTDPQLSTQCVYLHFCKNCCDVIF